jgi:hypothetical protein
MLDLLQIAGQMGEAGRRETERRTRFDTHVARAAARAGELEAALWAEQSARIRASRTSWLVACCDDPPAARTPAPAAPEKYVVIATDGSQVAPDRHEGVGGCYLINVGRILISYGAGLRPRLDSRAEVLIADDEDEEAARNAMSQIRYGRELKELSGLIEEANPMAIPAVALVDGSLIAWHLYDEKGDDLAKKEALRSLIATLDCAQAASIPIAGYISDPGARDIVNALRITLCPHETVNCFRCPQEERTEPACTEIRTATDAGLFAQILAPGERSPVFTARNLKTFTPILAHYGPHWIGFFYLKVPIGSRGTASEIARVEIPAWVADDPALVAQVHAICLDQATKGRGYPVALAEAHEQAVVRGADREAFLAMLRRAFVRQDVPVAVTRKALAKRTRAV